MTRENSAKNRARYWRRKAHERWVAVHAKKGTKEAAIKAEAAAIACWAEARAWKELDVLPKSNKSIPSMFRWSRSELMKEARRAGAEAKKKIKAAH